MNISTLVSVKKFLVYSTIKYYPEPQSTIPPSMEEFWKFNNRWKKQPFALHFAGILVTSRSISKRKFSLNYRHSLLPCIQYCCPQLQWTVCHLRGKIDGHWIFSSISYLVRLNLIHGVRAKKGLITSDGFLVRYPLISGFLRPFLDLRNFHNPQLSTYSYSLFHF